MEKKEPALIEKANIFTGYIKGEDYLQNGFITAELWESLRGYVIYVHRPKSGVLVFHKLCEDLNEALKIYGRTLEIIECEAYTAEERRNRFRRLLYW